MLFGGGGGGGGGERCENPVGLSMCEGRPMEAVFIKSCVPFERWSWLE